MVRTLLLATALGFAACAAQHEISRVALPGTDLEVVLFQDVKNMHLYQVQEGGIAVTDLRLLGPHPAEQIAPPEVRTAGPLVTVSWRDEYANHFLTIDPLRRVIVSDSNSSGRPPEIRTSH